MGRSDEFGPESRSVRAWLEKRDTYAGDGARADERAPEPEPPAPEPPRSLSLTAGTTSARVDATGAGRAVLDALVGPPAPADAAPEASALLPDAAVPGSDPTTTLPSTAPRTPPGPRWSEPEEVAHEVDASTDVVFPPRTHARRAMSVLLIAAWAATAVVAVEAAKTRSAETIMIALVVGVVALVIWGVRAAAVPTELEISRGQLVVRRGGTTELIDIANPHTPVAVVGEPGLRGWAVLVERADRPLLSIDAAMVDPYWFTTALYRVRPDLRPAPQQSIQ